MSEVVDVITAPVDFIADLIEEIPLIGPPIAEVIQAPVHLLVGDADPLVHIIEQAAGPLLAVVGGVPSFLPGGPAIAGTGTPLDIASVLRVGAEVGLRLIGVNASIDNSVGVRLENLVRQQGGVVDLLVEIFGPNSQEQTKIFRGLLNTVLGQFFPELAKARVGLDDLIFRQFPGVGGSARQSGRYQGVRRETLQIATKRKWVPSEWAAQRRIHNPDGEADDIPSVTGFEGYDPDEGWGPFQTMMQGTLFEGIATAIAEIPRNLIAGAVEGGRQLLLAGGEIVPELAGALSNVVRDTFGSLGEFMVESVKERLERAGPIGPGGQGEVAKDLLGQAFTFGVGAHITASAVELLMPLKHLGLPQIAAFMADLAGFGGIAAAQLGPLVAAGIKRPAEWEANEIFRSNLPAVRDAKQFVLERIIGLDDYRAILRWNGYPEEWVEAYVAEVWEEPSLRELSTVVDDTPVDEDWLRVKVRETGLSDEDVELFLAGLQRRANKSVRQAYMSSLQSAFRDGLLEEGELEGELERLNLNLEARELIRRRAILERRRELTDLWERAFRVQAENEVMDLDDYRMALRSLGLSEDRVAVLVAVGDATLRGRFAREERADLKRLIREDQATRVQLAREAFRRGRVTQDQLFAMLVSVGIEERQADAMVALEAVRVQPVPRGPAVLTLEAQRERENELIRDAALVAFREGKVDEAALVRVLSSLGIPQRELEALVTLELARKDKPKPVVVREDPATVRARQLKTEAAIFDFRAGKISLELLRIRLTEAGHPPVVVEAFVERELARLAPPA